MTECLKIFRANEKAIIPSYSTQSSACFDLHACITPDIPIKFHLPYDNSSAEWQGFFQPDYKDKIDLWPKHRYLIPTGLIFDIPFGHSIRVHPRSGLALKNGITLMNCEGVIDEDYVEPVYVILLNTSEVRFTIKNGDRIAQAELVKDLKAEFLEIGERPVSKTNRSGGFGSTGL